LPIAENSSLLPPVGVWAVLNPSVAVRPLRPATDRRLGRLLPPQLANRPQAHPKAARSRKPLLLSLHQQDLMRACRRFLAGIPLFGAGHPCVTHPSATPSPSVKEQGVRLACVRHAASVYPEPGSNSPSVVYFPTCAHTAHRWLISSVLELRSRPSSSSSTWLFADSCSCSLQNTSLILDRNCCGRLRVSPVAVLLSTLQLSRYYRKQVLLTSSPPSRDR
jgi:hypothetical protein